MSNVKIKRTETSGDYSHETYFKASDFDHINKKLIKAHFAEQGEKQQPEPKTVVLKEPVKVKPDMQHEVVAIYDNAGIPSIMHRFTRITNKELFGGSDKVNPAFIIGGHVYDEIYISVYENCNINGKPYSLPYQKPWTGITNDEAAAACFSKGEGWHMMTAPEWGLLANLSLKSGTLPHGNTNNGKYHADETEHGQTYGDYGKTLTGSGPATWTHDHTPEGVHDLCGNIWEMLRGARIKDGAMQAAKDNDAALDIDLTAEGDGWQTVKDDSGNSIRVSVEGDTITITTNQEIGRKYTSSEWGDVRVECESERLKELALFAGEPEVYCYMDSTTDGEYLLYRGGYWGSTTNAGVFNSAFAYPRSCSHTILGFRSAYFRKTEN